ncbi:MAG TPA: hypothetical protein ENK18_22395 [Deltaproteobacteria bacterium]|nr:hypothetical protein [Deltaproteobacteria bacterium]
MDSSFFWIFMIFTMLQPILSRRWLEARRLAALRTFERERKSRAILMIHRQESMGFLGFPLVRYISVEDSEAVLRAIRMTDDDCPIDLILHTPGGLVLAASQIAEAVRAHPARVTVYVPHHAMSGGTLIALAADEIVMDPSAVLGQVDPQLGDMPAASLVALVDAKPVEHVDDATWVKADMARKALAQIEAQVRRLLDRYPPEVVGRAIEVLAVGRHTHDHPLRAEELAALELPVSTDFPELLHDLLSMYEQPKGRAPSVEYVPEPYGARRSP